MEKDTRKVKKKVSRYIVVNWKLAATYKTFIVLNTRLMDSHVREPLQNENCTIKMF